MKINKIKWVYNNKQLKKTIEESEKEETIVFFDREDKKTGNL
jgi:hypothetical protein